MSFDPSGNEFAREPVPPHIGISGWRIALIKVGVLIALPAFIMGAELGFKLGYQRSLLAFFAGALILYGLALGTTTVGARTRLSTAMLIQFTFGRVGAKVVSLVLAATLAGWFGVTAELFGDSLVHVFVAMSGGTSGSAAFIVSGGVLMVLTTIYGIRGLQRLADMSVPLLLVALAVIAWLGFQKAPAGILARLPSEPVSIGVGISAVVGSMAAGVTIFPDVGRFASTPAHARLAALLTLLFGVPLVLGLTALPAVATGEGSLIAMMLGLGLGVPALLLLVFTAWTTNSGNLYSSSLMLGTVFIRCKQRTLVMLVGVVGVMLAIGGISSYLIPVLLLVGFSIPPIAGLYITDYFLVRNGRLEVAGLGAVPAFRLPVLTAWLAAVAVALMTSNDLFSLTTVPACDSILTSMGLYALFYALGWARDEGACAAGLEREAGFSVSGD